ncbi:SAM-dependent methyltransferase [Flammeovirga pectinis]|uniref:SAM-dependent methyltransferase n=1 Tax=Flammeovirga pectinis TaxID=2494373 RepID=A0A3Q9FM38_9BACT|nr:class I SAM-dependent methyltransferase [Flammeovirga pectinis]AZQ63256.1 SAM-dependent methyltransferase [Flammeovirga pectinis]
MINQETKKFILDNEKENPSLVVLKAAKFANVDGKVAAQQIGARQKAKKKLPSWYENTNIEYPSKVPLEQCSSERAANFKSKIVKGNSLIDLTGGMGVDDWAFSKHFSKVTYFERQKDLSEITKRNFTTLNQLNIDVKSGDSLEWLQENSNNFDVIYLDPARRDKENRKLVRVEDCEPNVLEFKDLLFHRADKVLVKLSPMIDIKSTLRSLPEVSNVWVVSVDGECKEVLFLLEKQESTDVKIHTVDLKGEKKEIVFSFNLKEEEQNGVELASELHQYLYEPNASVMKGGAFKSISNRFGLKKLHINSHLYISDVLIEDFPGRKFEVTKQIQAQKKSIKKEIPNLKANLSVRNFPQTVDQLRNKLKLKEGGEIYLFATTIMKEEKVLLVCKRIN